MSDKNYLEQVEELANLIRDKIKEREDKSPHQLIAPNAKHLLKAVRDKVHVHKALNIPFNKDQMQLKIWSSVELRKQLRKQRKKHG